MPSSPAHQRKAKEAAAVAKDNKKKERVAKSSTTTKNNNPVPQQRQRLQQPPPKQEPELVTSTLVNEVPALVEPQVFPALVEPEVFPLRGTFLFFLLEKTTKIHTNLSLFFFFSSSSDVPGGTLSRRAVERDPGQHGRGAASVWWCGLPYTRVPSNQRHNGRVDRASLES